MGIQKMKPGYGTENAKEILKKERKDQRSEAFLREHIAKTSLIMESSSKARQRMVENQMQLVTVMQIHAKEAQLQRRNQEQEANYQLFLQNPHQQVTAQEYLDQIVLERYHRQMQEQSASCPPRTDMDIDGDLMQGSPDMDNIGKDGNDDINNIISTKMETTTDTIDNSNAADTTSDGMNELHDTNEQEKE
jgi:hypothetical protein